jgi:predicted DNA binding protein
MKYIDARIKIQHPCPFCDFSKEFPDMTMSSWCNVENEVMQIIALDDDRLREICAYAKSHFETKEIAKGEKTILLATGVCLCGVYNSISSLVDKYDAWSVPPELYFGGWETHRIIFHTKSELNKFANDVKRIGKIEVVSLRERDQLDMLNSLGVAPINFLGGLTDKQMHAIIVAYENGLFDVPAKTDMDRIAKLQGISRSTYGEHLRKAIHQIMENSYPILKLNNASTKSWK